MELLSKEKVDQLRQNARLVVRELGLLNDAYFEIGVTLAERHLLIELNGCRPTMGEIADRLLIDKSTVSRLIAKAMKKGFIQCTIDEKDKRKRLLALTEKGRKVLHDFEPIAFNQTKQALLTLSEQEMHTVYQGVFLYATGLKRSRTKQPYCMPKQQKEIEKLSTITKHLRDLGYLLRPFQQKDEQALYAIFQEVVNSGIYFPYISSTIEEFHLHFFRPHGKIYTCHSQAGEVIGGYCIQPNFSDRSSHIANAIYMIKDTHRSQGIGSLLVKASLHHARELGFGALQFNRVLSQNTLAVKLYEKLGFQIIGILPDGIKNKEGSYQDAYIMHRKLEGLKR